MSDRRRRKNRPRTRGGQTKAAKARRAEARVTKVATGPKVAPSHEATATRVLEAIGKLTPAFKTFQGYLAERTTRADGTTWTLSDMAAELGIPPAVFISYHARWVDEAAPRAI